MGALHPTYRYPVEKLRAGASLGNYLSFAALGADTSLHGLWSARDNQFYVGKWSVEVLSDGRPMQPVETIFTPESQTTRLEGGKLSAERQFFLPYSPDRAWMSPPSVLQSAMFILRITNASSSPADVRLRQTILFPPERTDLFTKQPPREQINKRVAIRRDGDRCFVSTVGREAECRIFGLGKGAEILSADDRGLVTEQSFSVAPGNTMVLTPVVAYSPDGEQAALEVHRKCFDVIGLLNSSIEEYRALLAHTEIVTPEPAINRAIQWAKVNMARVQHRYAAGEGFTNDPPQDIVVIRDLAWYVLGADYLTPDFSKNLIALTECRGFHPSGKLTEYLHASEEAPTLHDYGLNINDDTPLFVIALHHHASGCADEYGPARAYPMMKRACDLILSQRRDGLIHCDATGNGVHGICGWRNIIDGYTLNGAVTEINAECYRALILTAETARFLGKVDEEQRYRAEADRLRDCINSTLLSEETGMYLLNIAADGVRRHDRTGDLIFPVLFDAAGSGAREKILDTLTGEAFWTPYGARTVARDEHNYDPELGYQLVGGVWPNLSAWIAYCMRGSNPERLVEGMMNIYRISEVENPRSAGYVVPGEFPERLHGENFTSRGMAMSPWMPPTYLWLAVEGLLGVESRFGDPEMNPSIPHRWGWIAVRDLLFRGEKINAFLHSGVLYASRPVRSKFRVRVGEAVEHTTDQEGFFCIALRTELTVFLFVAALQDASGSVQVKVEGKRMRHSITLKQGEAVLKSIPLDPEHAMASGLV